MQFNVSWGQLTDDNFVGIHIVIQKSDNKKMQISQFSNIKINQPIAVLVESDYKYAINDESHRLRGGLIQEELLKHRGWKVINIKTQEFYKLVSLQAQQQYLAKLISNVSH
eukprot:TRINITY_DN6587_c0_g1_i3.p2 TRINITY_DN6587_c0_g1~~TRINITY_DN6587_c0_g1_i3.p2  ORF type:complete len:111 (-),score=2.31 TRINITY_DN6587_c0_g1_i3:205-537(-)